MSHVHPVRCRPATTVLPREGRDRNRSGVVAAPAARRRAQPPQTAAASPAPGPAPPSQPSPWRDPVSRAGPSRAGGPELGAGRPAAAAAESVQFSARHRPDRSAPCSPFFKRPLWPSGRVEPSRTAHSPVHRVESYPCASVSVPVDITSWTPTGIRSAWPGEKRGLLDQNNPAHRWEFLT